MLHTDSKNAMIGISMIGILIAATALCAIAVYTVPNNVSDQYADSFNQIKEYGGKINNISIVKDNYVPTLRQYDSYYKICGYDGSKVILQHCYVNAISGEYVFKEDFRYVIPYSEITSITIYNKV